MKVYIAGAGGMLGDAFYRKWSPHHDLRCSDLNANEEWLISNDFRNFRAYREQVLEFGPDLLIHLGAHTDLEYCECNPDDAFLTNTISVEYAVSIANELSIPILYISTAGIFDGQMPDDREFYDDWDKPNPLGVYARTKYLGEQYVVTYAKLGTVLRAGWMMGGGEKKDKKFISKLIKQIKTGSTTLNIVDDKDGTPTFTDDFAENARYLLENNCRGVYNLVCGGLTSRYEVTIELLKLLNRKDIKINKVNSDFFADDYFAPRPVNERLRNYRLDLLGKNKMRDWRICLEEYVHRDYKALIKC